MPCISYPVNSMKPGEAYTIGLSAARAFVMQKDLWEGLTRARRFESAASILWIIAWTTCKVTTTKWHVNQDTRHSDYKVSKNGCQNKSMHWSITSATSSGSCTSHPKSVLAVTGMGIVPFTSSFRRSFSVRSFNSCFRNVSNSAFFLHLVFRASTLFRSLK